MLKNLFAYQLMLATCLLSTWFGYQLASQSPNPSWHHSVLLNSPQNTRQMCHSVSLAGIPCQLGAWDMVAEAWQVDTLRGSKLSRTQGKCRQLMFGLLKWKKPRIQISKSKNFCWPCDTFCMVAVNLVFARTQDKAWKLWSATLPN